MKFNTTEQKKAKDRPKPKVVNSLDRRTPRHWDDQSVPIPKNQKPKQNSIKQSRKEQNRIKNSRDKPIPKMAYAKDRSTPKVDLHQICTDIQV